MGKRNRKLIDELVSKRLQHVFGRSLQNPNVNLSSIKSCDFIANPLANLRNGNHIEMATVPERHLAPPRPEA